VKTLPPEYLPSCRAALTTCGKLTLSEQNALALLKMAEQSITFRRALEQIAGSGSSNAELAMQATNALRDDVSYPVPRKRLVGIETLNSKARPAPVLV
jgi:hypothetical protein